MTLAYWVWVRGETVLALSTAADAVCGGGGWFPVGGGFVKMIFEFFCTLKVLADFFLNHLFRFLVLFIFKRVNFMLGCWRKYI